MNALDAKTIETLTQDAVRWLDKLGTWALGTGLRVLLVLLLVWITLKIGRRVLEALFARISRHQDVEYAKRIDTLHSITAFSFKAGLLAIGGFVILGQLGINLGPILAAAGILGLAVGFGAQTLVQDVISGFFLLVEDQVRVGDVIQVGDKGGLVESITLRLIVLRDLAGNVHYIRNGKVDIVTNMTKDYSRYVFDIGVAYKEDVDRVIEVVKGIDEEMREDPQYKFLILEPLEVLGLDRFDDSAVVVRARTKTLPIQQWTVAREFNRRMKKRFDELGIDIPFPHRTLYFGDGQAERLRPPAKGQAAKPEDARDTEQGPVRMPDPAPSADPHDDSTDNLPG
ncbi:MscS Mechanosensitive ion channel [Desulfovibrio sp. X2]|uniref:mechanosensitive ion channel family protein n=1 Tax=Desulfovibrio sp. X2 TaxID=941449 RepID=UPI0003587996|nr:mechanosensitive ion channel family protein [Desulfovibrio sp. X2]EPR37653.1 MscS Mechanosensitive ion channel [Desulfovibrio sp. X2]